MARKLRYFHDEIAKAGQTPSYRSMTSDNELDLDELESKLTDLGAELLEINANTDKLQRTHSELTELQLVLQKETNHDTEWCPRHLRLLRNLYGPRLRSLEELVQDLLHHELSNNQEIGLVRDGDSVEYSTLLKQSFAVLPEGAPDRIVGGESMNQRWSQQQVVERSIQLHLREGASSNVLCFGYGQVQSTGSNKQISVLKGPEYHHLNVAAGFISTHLWVTLLARVGEERMLYLLSYAAIFVPLPNYCLLQVAGHSFSSLAASNMKQIRQTIKTTRKSQYELLTVPQKWGQTIKQNTSVETRVMVGENGDVTPQTLVDSITCQPQSYADVGPCDEVREDVTRCGKRVRPSSWVRRKQRRREGTHSGCQRSVSTAEGVNTAEPAIRSPCTVKMEISNPVQRVGLPPRLIDRSAIFYHSSFSCHAGLPANQNTDILNTTNVNEADISQLLGSMFKALDSAGSTSGEPSTSTAGKAAEELTKNVKGLLRKMFRNSKRCNYARLLSRHCPLPSYVASPLPKVKTSRLQDKKQQVMSNMYSILSKEAHITQEMEVGLLPSAAANTEFVEFKDTTTRSDFRKQHCQQETYKRLSSISFEFPAADFNPLGSSKKICNMMRSSKPLNVGPKGDSSLGKLMHIKNFRKPAVVDDRSHEKGRDAGPTPDLAKLVTLSTSHSQVVNFLWAVCRSVLPEEFLGSERFRRTLCSGIASFVSLRRHETFHVQPLLNKLQISTSAWPEFREDGQIYLKQTKSSGCLSKLRDLPKAMLTDWLHWLFTEVIVPLLRGHFYVTEAENHRQNVLYYRKPVWAKIQMLSLNHLVAKSYKRLDPATVAAVLEKRVLGFSHIRMLPKHSGVRPIANLSSKTRCTLPLMIRGPNVRESSALCGKRRRCSLRDSINYEVDCRPPTRSGKLFREVNFAFKSINSRLRGVHTCLKFEQENHSRDLGASVFGYKDAYVKFLPYIMHLKSLPGGLPPMYMAVCDISKAYDTIKQDKLCEVVSGFLRLPVYHIRRYVTIFNTMGSTRASYKQTCTASDQERDIFNLFVDLAARRSHSILQDQGAVTRLKQGHILGLIEEHVKRNIVKIGPHFYLQKLGIAQGSVLSPLLCSVFFGHLDEHVLMPLLQQTPQPLSSVSSELRSQREGKTELLDTLEVSEVLENDRTILLRLIDDSLLISTSRSSVARFVQLMHDGFEEYGCHANQQKTAVSFDLLLNNNQVIKAHGVYMTSDGARFMRWSGLLINCGTLEVQADYTRYIGEPIKGSITVVRKTNPGAQVPIKLCHFVRAKCHPMLYDLRINSPSTIRLNAYQAFLLCAMKSHAYLCSMERTCHHSPFLLEAIEGTSGYMHGLLRKQMQEMGDSVHLGATKDEMTWLALHAFLKVLKKKQSRYGELLFLIQERLDMPKYRVLSRCPHLASALDENRSSMFKFIIY